MKRWISVIMLILLGVVLVIGCAPKAPKPPGEVPTEETPIEVPIPPEETPPEVPTPEEVTP